jgi:AcrR family transcriptional regulator
MSKQPAAPERPDGTAERPAGGRAAGGAWQWGRTAQTQRALLDAARAVFAEQGFDKTSIADLVERAGSSVGSLYHHFGGKSELFLALWQEHQQVQEEAASQAVAQARRAGVTDTTELFCAGARAFLEGCSSPGAGRPASRCSSAAAAASGWPRTTRCSACRTPRWPGCTLRC